MQQSNKEAGRQARQSQQRMSPHQTHSPQAAAEPTNGKGKQQDSSAIQEKLKAMLTQVHRGESAPRVTGQYPSQSMLMPKQQQSSGGYNGGHAHARNFANHRYTSSVNNPNRGLLKSRYAGQANLQRRPDGAVVFGRGHQQRPHGLLGPQPEHLRGRKTLVLDLDETLVHSQFNPVRNADYTVAVDIEGRVSNIYVQKRPGAEHFLQQMAQVFEVVIYTASLSKYADPLMDMMDPHGYATARLFREHCTFVNGVFVKDMAQIGRPMKDAIIIDNSPTSYMLQPECGLPIISWYDDPRDRALFDYIPMLVEMSKISDMREGITGFVRNNTFSINQAMGVLAKIQAREQAQERNRIEKERAMKECMIQMQNKNKAYKQQNQLENQESEGGSGAVIIETDSSGDDQQTKPNHHKQQSYHTATSSNVQPVTKHPPLINSFFIKQTTQQQPQQNQPQKHHKRQVHQRSEKQHKQQDSYIQLTGSSTTKIAVGSPTADGAPIGLKQVIPSTPSQPQIQQEKQRKRHHQTTSYLTHQSRERSDQKQKASSDTQQRVQNSSPSTKAGQQSPQQQQQQVTNITNIIYNFNYGGQSEATAIPAGIAVTGKNRQIDHPQQQNVPQAQQAQLQNEDNTQQERIPQAVAGHQQNQTQPATKSTGGLQITTTTTTTTVHQANQLQNKLHKERNALIQQQQQQQLLTQEDQEGQQQWQQNEQQQQPQSNKSQSQSDRMSQRKPRPNTSSQLSGSCGNKTPTMSSINGANHQSGPGSSGGEMLVVSVNRERKKESSKGQIQISPNDIQTKGSNIASSATTGAIFQAMGAPGNKQQPLMGKVVKVTTSGNANRKSTIDTNNAGKMIVVLDKNRAGSQKKQDFIQNTMSVNGTSHQYQQKVQQQQTANTTPVQKLLDNKVFQVSLNGNGGTVPAKQHLKSKLKQNIDGSNPFIVTGPNSPKVLPIEMIGSNQRHLLNQIKTPQSALMGSMSFKQNGSGNAVGPALDNKSMTANRAIKAFTPSAAACNDMRGKHNNGLSESYFNFNMSPTAASQAGNNSQSVMLTPHGPLGSSSLKNSRGAHGFHSTTNAVRQGQSTALEGTSKQHPHLRSNIINGIGDKRSYSQNQGSRSNGISNILAFSQNTNEVQTPSGAAALYNLNNSSNLIGNMLLMTGNGGAKKETNKPVRRSNNQSSVIGNSYKPMQKSTQMPTMPSPSNLLQLQAHQSSMLQPGQIKQIGARSVQNANSSHIGGQSQILYQQSESPHLEGNNIQSMIATSIANKSRAKKVQQQSSGGVGHSALVQKYSNFLSGPNKINQS